ncbi:hypothetical protein [Flavobacterium humidisoli]|uniref:Uncharacterized protein n=1 Tax=Flavobacterium humidisoli TaxID=2937442 RepID=A0ABY4LQC3_9FLAO|nr:hypothetical protein [Flavobacterium humidisoli]UPZ14808.1 hypothetical protein M0M44_18850 [Flavobacterium humidisoli]
MNYIIKKASTIFPAVISVSQSDTQSDMNFTDTAIQPDIQNSNLLSYLYHKSEDEPDFDCEFLHAAHDLNENESIIDPESDDELLDEFNDNQWDADIYDPYVESTYY